MNSEPDHHRIPWYQSRKVIILGMVAIIIAFFVVREHWEHLTGKWIYLLLLACPLMHLFHGGHSQHDKAGGSDDSKS